MVDFACERWWIKGYGRRVFYYVMVFRNCFSSRLLRATTIYSFPHGSATFCVKTKSRPKEFLSRGIIEPSFISIFFDFFGVGHSQTGFRFNFKCNFNFAVILQISIISTPKILKTFATLGVDFALLIFCEIILQRKSIEIEISHLAYLWGLELKTFFVWVPQKCQKSTKIVERPQKQKMKLDWVR